MYKKFTTTIFSLNSVIGILGFGYLSFQVFGSFSYLITMVYVVWVINGASDLIDKPKQQSRVFNPEAYQLHDLIDRAKDTDYMEQYIEHAQHIDDENKRNKSIDFNNYTDISLTKKD